MYGALVDLKSRTGWEVDARLLAYAAGVHHASTALGLAATGGPGRSRAEAAAGRDLAADACGRCGGRGGGYRILLAGAVAVVVVTQLYIVAALGRHHRSLR